MVLSKLKKQKDKQNKQVNDETKDINEIAANGINHTGVKEPEYDDDNCDDHDNDELTMTTMMIMTRMTNIRTKKQRW